jgi:hypothetical protein
MRKHGCNYSLLGQFPQSSFFKILWQETTAVQLLFAHFLKSTTVDNVAFVFVPELFSLSVGMPEVVLQTFRYLQLIVKIPGILTYYCYHSEKRERMRKKSKDDEPWQVWFGPPFREAKR